MRAITNTIELNVPKVLETWTPFFDVQVSNARFVHMITLMTPVRGDIYTSRLPYTSHLYGAIATGGVSLLRGGESGIGLSDVLDTLLLISLHQRIARSGAGLLLPPAFWVRVDLGEGGVSPRVPRPVLSFEQLSLLAGRSEDALRVIVAPLMRDGALRMVPSKGSGEGVMLADGHVDDVTARLFYKI
jgi:hypothetical protein